MILGNLVDWWEPESKNKYLKKTQCIIEQYGNYTVEVCDMVKRIVQLDSAHWAKSRGHKVLDGNSILREF